AQARPLRARDERPARCDEAHTWDPVPVPHETALQDRCEDLLPFAVDTQVDERMLPQERLGPVGHLGPAEDDQRAWISRLDVSRDLERNPDVPDVRAEENHPRAVEPSDGLDDGKTAVDRQEELVC